jgi:hypothetical protein
MAAKRTKKAPPPPIPTPEERRRRPDISGVAVTLHGGGEWLLARASLVTTPGFRLIRDRLFDEWALSGKLDVAVIRAAALCLLVANYDLAHDEAAALVLTTDPGAFGDAVLDATVNVDPPGRRWTDWALSVLYANGIEPAKVPGDALLGTLNQLILTGRAVPPQEWTDAGIAGAEFGGLRRLAQRVEAGRI